MKRDDITVNLIATIAFLLFLAMMPVALIGGFFASKYIYCDLAKLCELKK